MIDVSVLPELVTAEAYPVVVQSYETHPALYPELVDVRDISETNLYGTKGSVLEAVGRFRERADGQEAEADQPGKAYTWQCKIRQFTRRIDIPKRLLDSLGSSGKVVDYVQQQTRHWGLQAIREKEDFVAGMLQKGTLTAGSTTYFDNSFPDNDDSNAGFIYDGLPAFDTAHTLSGVSGTTKSNHTVSGALTNANLQTVLTTMRQTNAVDDRGERIMIVPSALVIPANLIYTARTILGSQQLPGSANNDVNPNQGELRIIPHPYLTDDTGAWWVADLSGMGGIRMWDSGMPTLESQYDAKSKVLSIVAEMHFGATFVDWRQWYCSNKAAS